MKKTISVFFFIAISYFLNSQNVSPYLYAFDFPVDEVLSKMPISERASTFVKMGFKGVTFAIRDDSHIDKLQKYLDTDEVKNGTLELPVVYCVMDFSKPLPPWEKVLETSPNTDIWLIFREASKEQILETLSEMSKKAKQKDVDIVIYPHNGTSIESVEETLHFIKDINVPNLYLSLHLCHEISAGNGNRLKEIAKEAKPYLKYVSISGSNMEAGGPITPKYRTNVIQPLYEGDFPVERFVEALQSINYTGKTFLHTWGIKESMFVHIPKSYEKWRTSVETH